MAVCFQIHTKHINTLCGQNVELLNVQLPVHIVTTGLSNISDHLPLYVTASTTLIHPDVFATYFSLVRSKEGTSLSEGRNRFPFLNE